MRLSDSSSIGPRHSSHTRSARLIFRDRETAKQGRSGLRVCGPRSGHVVPAAPSPRDRFRRACKRRPISPAPRVAGTLGRTETVATQAGPCPRSSLWLASSVQSPHRTMLALNRGGRQRAEHVAGKRSMSRCSRSSARVHKRRGWGRGHPRAADARVESHTGGASPRTLEIWADNFKF